MNTMDFLAKWPGWSNKTPAELLSSPAWAMRVRWGDDEALLRISDNRPRDIVALKIALDGEEHFLGIGQRDAFPDLSALWSRKDEIPQTLVLALVEKECGKLLQLIENAVRRQLTVIGLTDATDRADSNGFEVVGKDGSVIVSFALNISPMVEESLGDIAAIDISHYSIREMTRQATAEYASFVLGAEMSSINSGDYLLMPELENLALAKWCVEQPLDDGKYHLRATESVSIAFSEFVDGLLPTIPKPDALELYFGSRLIATGRIAALGGQYALAIEEVL